MVRKRRSKIADELLHKKEVLTTARIIRYTINTTVSIVVLIFVFLQIREVSVDNVINNVCSGSRI